MTQQRLKALAQRIAPGMASRARQWRRVGQARLLRKELEDARTLGEKVDLVLGSPNFRANQNRTEILALLRLLQDLQPSHVCEIGTAEGGTLALFCQVAAPDAKILSVDIGYRSEQVAAHSQLAQRGQELTCLATNSHAPETLLEVQRWLAGTQIDFLFIDGDHSLAGVSTDYETYVPLVDHTDGLVALHDIVPDFKTRHGVPTPADVGQVPEYWAQLKLRADVTELIEHSGQDGMGIGVVRMGRGSRSD